MDPDPFTMKTKQESEVENSAVSSILYLRILVSCGQASDVGANSVMLRDILHCILSGKNWGLYSFLVTVIVRVVLVVCPLGCQSPMQQSATVVQANTQSAQCTEVQG